MYAIVCESLKPFIYYNGSADTWGKRVCGYSSKSYAVALANKVSESNGLKLEVIKQ